MGKEMRKIINEVKNGKDLNKYCGLYLDKNGQILREISIENGLLVYKRSLHNRTILKHIENDIFVMKDHEFIQIEFKDVPKSYILTNLDIDDVNIFSIEGINLEKCPVCFGKAHISFKEQEKLYQVNCFEKCGVYNIGDINSFNFLSDKHREWIAALNNNLSYNNIINHYYSETIKWVIEEYEFIETVAGDIGLTDVEIEYAGGCDGADPVYIIKTKDKKYSIRLYHPEYDLSIIKTEIYWQNDLSEQGIIFAKIFKGSTGKQIHYSDSLKRYSVLREWIDGEPLFNLEQIGLPEDMPVRLGELLANMHKAALSMKVPDNCTFVKRGYRYYDEFYKRHLKTEFITEAEKEEFIYVYSNFLKALKELDDLDDQLTLVHGDITSRNIIYCNDKYIPIDLKQIKYDYLLLDIVQLFLNKLPEVEHEKFWKGYEKVRKVPDKWKELYPALMEAIGMGLIRV